MASDQATPGKKAEPNSGEIKLSVPWETASAASKHSRGNIARQSIMFADDETNKVFIQERSRVHQLHIRETEKTKRWGYGLAAFLLALACVIPVFAPADRETLSYMVGLALLVFAAGTAGYTRVRLQGKKRSADFDGRS
jgi:hypothetical protein